MILYIEGGVQCECAVYRWCKGGVQVVYRWVYRAVSTGSP